MPRLSRRALILVLVVGVLYWMLDALYLYVSFHSGEVVLPAGDGPSLLGTFATDIPRHALAGRVTFVAAIMLVAAIATFYARNRDAREAVLLHQLESAGDLFSRHDLQGRYLYASAGHADLLGIEPDRLLGLREIPEWEVLDRAEFEASLARLLASDQPEAMTTHLRHHDGRELWLESVGRRVAARGGDEVVLISRDVTARHEAEAALAANEQRLRLITENMQEILWLRVGERLHYINSAVERIFGVPQEQLGDRGLRSWLPWMHPDDRERMRLAMDQALDHHEPLDEEFRIVRSDGQVRWLHARTVHVETDPHGRPMTVGVAADVTGRRRAEDTLRSTAARYRTLYDAAHVGITITDLAGQVLYANQAAAELFGTRSVAGLLDHARSAAGIRGFFCDPGERDVFVRAMQDDERGQASRTFAVRRVDGREIQLRVSCGLLVNPETGRQEILAILEDVTERQRAEQELRRSEERYRRLVEFIPDGILVHDRERVLLANPACADLFGMSGVDLPGTRLSRLVPDLSLLATREPGREGWLCRQDGTQFPASVTSLPLQEGEAPQVLTVLKDLTGIRRAGEEIAAQQAILSALIETMPLGIVAKDLGGDLEYVVWNRYMEQELGLAKAAVLGRRDRDVFTSDFAQEMRRQDRIAAGRGEAVDLGEVTMPWRGDSLVLRVVKVPVRDASGMVTRIFTLVENVTQQKRLRESLDQSQRMEAVGRLAAAVAHDFNNMLQVVQGYSESIQQSLPGDSPLAGDVALVLSAVSRARELVQRLLAYSRYDSLDPELLDLNRLCTTAVAAAQATSGSIEIRFTPAANLPRVYADPRQIEQVILNLLHNASDALPAEGVIDVRTATVTLGEDFCSTRPWARQGRYVQLTVRDEGCGIPPDARERIYEPFYTTKGFGQGTGLGLAAAYNICKQHQGYIDFESELDVGTSFHVFLPVPQLHHEETPEPPVGAAQGKGELLLLVEDDDLVRSLTRQMLERAGYQVLDARDGEDAMEIFMAHAMEIRALVLDVVMPRMDGRVLYDNISELRPGVPVLFCSSYSADLLESEYMLEMGAQLLSKPYRAADLLARVRGLLDR